MQPTVPEKLTKYAQLVRVADKLEWQANNNRNQRVKVSSYVGLWPQKTFRDQADSAYERALEYLQELLEAEPSLWIWLDRPVSFKDHEDSPAATREGVPRLCNSTSPYRLGKRSLYPDPSKW